MTLLIHMIEEEEKAGCFTLIAFLMSCDQTRSVALPSGLVCSVRLLYFLIILNLRLLSELTQFVYANSSKLA